MRDVVVAASCGAFVALMVGMAYAAVPLYDWFCRTTGFGGTHAGRDSGAGQCARSQDHGALRRQCRRRAAVAVRRRSAPPSRSRLGDVITVDYTVINEAARETAGTAAYNVTPLTIGAYFQKINCFCFTEQR